MSPAKKISHIGEFGLINVLAKLLRTQKGIAKSIGDDAAVMASQGDKVLLFTTDMMSEGVHFKKSMGARLIGRKALACNVSDIAAMGGMPLAAVVSIGMPPSTPVNFVKEIYRGMESIARQFNLSIVGGDTIKSQRLIINVALLGEAGKGKVVYRCGAKQGDLIFVTGALGRSLQSGKHLSFTPRIAEAQFLINHFKPSAMIDISDGLAGDLGHILKQSSVGAVIYEKLIPKRAGATIQNALYDGEDFELLFTLPVAEAKKLLADKKSKFRFHFIGQVLNKKEKLTLLDRNNRRVALLSKGFVHF